MGLSRKVIQRCITKMVWIITYSALSSSMSCENENNKNNDAEIARPSGWTKKTHGNKATPNYDVVFAHNEVKRLDLIITADNWKKMLDDMTQKYGEFGKGGMILPRMDGGIGGPGGVGPMGDGDGNRMPGSGNFRFGEKPVYVPCHMVFEEKTWWHLGIRFKGNSTLQYSWSSGTYKISLRVDMDQFESEYPEIKNQRFYGFKEFSLTSNSMDSSYLREKVTADIFREGGVPAPKTAFYRLYIDHGNGPVYFGLYTLIELPDTPLFKTQFKKGGGNLYKPEGSGANWGEFNESSFSKKTNKDDKNWADIKSAIDALHASQNDSSLWRPNLEKYFDPKGFMKWLAVNTVIVNWDTYGIMPHNYYLYGDPGDNGVLHWIPWDNNMALGIGMEFSGGKIGIILGDGGMPGGGGGMPGDGSVPEDGGIPGGGGEIPGGMRMNALTSFDMSKVGPNWPLISKLYADPIYRQIYLVELEKFVSDVFTVDAIQNKIKAEHNLIKKYVVGSEGEQPGHSQLTEGKESEEFENALQALLQHIVDRNKAALEFFSSKPSQDAGSSRDKAISSTDVGLSMDNSMDTAISDIPNDAGPPLDGGTTSADL